jgi:hypothetical protein
MSGRHTLLQENGDNQWLAYAGTFTVAILIVYIIKNILQKPKEPVGTEEIPTPKGALYYLGKNSFYFL